MDSNSSLSWQEQIEAFNQRWVQAEITGDVETLSRLLADDFICVGPLGFVLNKTQFLGVRQSDDLKHQALSWEALQLRLHGMTAITIGTQIQTATFQERDASGRFRTTQLLVQDPTSGDWSLTSLHLSPMSDQAATIQTLA